MTVTNKLTLAGGFPGEQFDNGHAINVLGYSDASGWNDKECASIGLISGVPEAFKAVRQSLALTTSDSELKWESVRSQPKAQVASDALESILNVALEGYLRVDVIIWNRLSRRMGYQGHDVLKVLIDMYSQLESTVMAFRWTSASSWTHFADQHDGLDWSIVDFGTIRRATRKSQRGGQRPSLEPTKPIEPVDSKKYRMVQLADLFAGLARFSYTHYDQVNMPQGSRPLPGLDGGWTAQSKASEYRSGVLREFLRKCEKRKLGVSLDSSKRGLVTQPTNRPVSFWHYEPQHPEDTGARRDDGRAY